MKSDDINRIFDVKESFKLPERIMEILFDESEKTRVMDAFMEMHEGLDHDWFTEYFEEEHSNKSKMHQDFTPKSVTDIITGISGKAKMVADICAGTGGLTIAIWNTNNEAWFHCEELSERAIPILLFNMVIRNMNGEVVHCDVLSQKIYNVYSINKGEQYSNVSVTGDYNHDYRYDLVVENPPYSLAWKYDEKKADERMVFGYPPTSKADYAFIQYGLYIMGKNGTFIAIVPHGVLFRGMREAIIRKGIVDSNMLRCVIGLPDNMFLNTGIPTCIIEFKENSYDVLFIDSSKNCRKAGRLNIMDEGHIGKIVECYQNRINVDRFSHVATKDEIIKNDYNLNIPRYVDTFEQEQVPDLCTILARMACTNSEIESTERELANMFKELVGTTPESSKELKQANRIFKESIIERGYVQEVLHFD